jgi:hypothetical protein
MHIPGLQAGGKFEWQQRSGKPAGNEDEDLYPETRRKNFKPELTMGYRFFCTVIICCFQLAAQSQEMADSVPAQKINAKYFEAVSKKAGTLEQQLDRKSAKALARLQKQEEKIKRKLAKIDSLAAHNVFAEAEAKYKQLEEKLKGPNTLTQYIPRLDTLVTSFRFLEQNQGWLSQAKDAKEKFNNAFSKVKELENRLQKAEDIKQFLKERRQYLEEQLSKFGLSKELKKINKEVYYYAQQINEYREILKDPKKVERKAIELLSKTKLFQDFMKKNSMLASLFRMPVDDPNDPTYQASLAGLQTRTQVNTLIQNQLAAGGPGAQQAFQQNLQQAQSQLQQLKDKVNKWGGGSSDDIMPEGFRPSTTKTKSFWQRLEFGTNIQTQKASNVFPVRSDIGFSIGYRITDRSIIGGGLNWSMGWGRGWNNIRISHQGVGLRTYADIKLKNSFWISGGYEKNYRSEIRNIDQLRNQSGWQQSGLIGVSKVVSVRSPKGGVGGGLFKKTKVQLLWDFLSYQQVPRAQPVLFRINYNF